MLMSILNIDSFIQCKYIDECFNLDIDIINTILNTFNNSDNLKIKKNKKIILQKQNILKNSKIQIIKDKVINKINLILNKLSENNSNNLVIEFINNIKFDDEKDFKEFSKAIYFKILNEFKFVKRYLEFYKIITLIYNKVYNYDTLTLINIIENKFKLDYLADTIVDTKYLFIIDISGEDYRLNNLYLIRELVNNNIISSNIYEYIDNIIINQNKYYSDIYYWFINNCLTESQLLQIHSIINNYDNITNLSTRDKILLESLSKNILNNNKTKNNLTNNKTINETTNEIKEHILNEIQDETINELTNESNNKSNNESNNKITNEPNNKIIIKNKNLIIKKDNIFNIEIENIINEYLYLESIEEIEYFINNSCIDAMTKNIFSEVVITIYFKSDLDDSNKIIILLKELIKKQILFKSNLSRGLLNLYNKYTNNIINNKVKFKNILSVLKNMGITKGLESLILKNNIK